MKNGKEENVGELDLLSESGGALSRFLFAVRPSRTILDGQSWLRPRGFSAWQLFALRTSTVRRCRGWGKTSFLIYQFFHKSPTETCTFFSRYLDLPGLWVGGKKLKLKGTSISAEGSLELHKKLS